MYNKRRFVQLFFLAVSVFILTGLIKGFIADVHSFCPYSIVCFGTLNIFSGSYFLMYHVTLFAGLLILISTLFLSRWFCNYICYFGTIQELLYSLFNRKKKKRLKLTVKVDNIFKKIKFIVLFSTVVLSVFGLSAFTRYCPQNVIASIRFIGISSIVFISVILLLSIFVERLWCKYLCPFGALMVLFIKISDFFNLKRVLVYRNLETCIDCYKCNNNCPMNVNLLSDEYIKDPECLNCNRCNQVCPKKGTITKKWR